MFTTRLRLIAAVACLVLVISIIALRTRTSQPSRPLLVVGEGIPASYKDFDRADVHARCQKLYDALKSNDWKPRRVPLELLYLPDQKRAASPYDRDPKKGSFVIPYRSPYYNKEIAAYSVIYTRSNLVVRSDTDMEANPEGFYLVIYKDGKIREIPVTDVRCYPIKYGNEDALIDVFPGMSIYRTELPQLPQVELSKKRLAQRKP